MSDNIMLYGEVGKDLLIPIDTEITDLLTRVLLIHFENRELKIKGKLEATYENDTSLGPCAKYTIDGTEGFKPGRFNCWVVITNEAGNFIAKTEPAELIVQYAPTITA